MSPSETAAFVKEPPTIEINDRAIAVLHYRGEPALSDRAMSVRNLARLGERIQRALKRHAAGDQNIIVDD